MPTSDTLNSLCTGECNSPTPSLHSITDSAPLQLRTPHPHSKYSDDSPSPPPPPHIPTTWKVAIGVDAFVLVITALILGMLVWILKKEYKKRRPVGEGYVGAKDGFGRRMKSARTRKHGQDSGRQRAWSYDPIREEEEYGEMEMGIGSAGLRESMEGGKQGQVTGNGKEGKASTKAKRAWGGKHVRFKSWSGDPRDKVGVVAGSSGKEERILELRVTDGPVDVQTP